MRLMLNNGLVSVVVPSYNGSQFIIETLQSVLNQTYSSLELIVVNDGSTDNSVELITALDDHRIQLITKENSGVSDSRNVGLKASEGEFILFLDADDLIQPDFIEKAVEIFKKDVSIDFLTTEIIHIDAESKIIDSPLHLRGTFENVQYEIASFQANVSTCPSAYIYRTSKLLEHYILFNSYLSSPADRYYILEVGAALKGGLIPNNQLKYRVHANSMSHLKNKKLVQDQENYLSHTLKNKVIVLKTDERIFKRKLNYQLFVDYLKMGDIPKTIKYGWNYAICVVFK